MSHVPERQCAGCGRRRPQAELVRVTATTGTAEIDRGRRAGGRGLYLCPDPACARTAVRRGALGRRLRRPVAGGDQLVERIEVEHRRGAWKDS
jgi:uncharacterized protein